MQQVLLFLAGLAVRSAALAAVALAGILILRVKSTAARHAVWTSVVIGMLALAVLAPLAPPVSIPILPAVSQAEVFPETAAPLRVDLAQPAVTPTVPAEPARAALVWQDAAAAIYILGVLFFLARLVFGYLFTLRLVRASARVAHPTVGNLYESSWISVPLTVGWLRPKILLPKGWQTWPSRKLEAVLTHEGAHIQRRDWAISLLAGLNRGFFWFHPLAWWLERTLASLAEQACDDVALLQVKSEHYAQVLLDMAAAVKSGQGRLVWEAMAMAKAAEVKRRIERILDDTRRIPQAFTRRRRIALFICAVPLVYMASVVRPAPAQSPATQLGDLKNKRQLSAADVSALEQSLVANPHDLEIRSQLVLYYFANGMRKERNTHVVWLLTNHPESDAAVVGSLGYSPRPNGLNDPEDYQQIAALWKQQAAAHPKDVRILINAGHFFSQLGSDYEQAERLLLSARSIEPSNRDVLDRLGKLYAKAILGTMGDAAFPNSAPALASRIRSQLESSTDTLLIQYTASALLSAAQRPAPGKPLPEGVLNLDDHGRLLPAMDFAERFREKGNQLSKSEVGGIGSGVFRAGGGVSAPIPSAIGAVGLPPAPTPLKTVDPEYPALARQARISGTVKLSVTIDASGNVQQLTVISGHPLLVATALEATRQWIFPSASAGTYQLPVNFTAPPPVAGDTPPFGASGKSASSPSDGKIPQRIRIGSNVQASNLVTKVDPVYPPAARSAAIEGIVTLAIVINEDGAVTKAEPVDGHSLLAAAAVDAVRQWTYKPTLLNGKPVEVVTAVSVPFSLER